MKVSYFDTSVLLPVIITQHPNHTKCLKTFEKAREKGKIATTTIHAYAELYSNLTRLPFGMNISPEKASEAILEHLGKIITPIDLETQDYIAAIRLCATKKLTSGVVYDALHIQAALKANADILYTANLKDFKRLYSKGFNFSLSGIS